MVVVTFSTVAVGSDPGRVEGDIGETSGKARVSSTLQSIPGDSGTVVTGHIPGEINDTV
jgi:hypothetical protein